MAELRERYGSQIGAVELVEGGGGVFDVELDGEEVYCKAETGRFPQCGEIPLIIDTKRLEA